MGAVPFVGEELGEAWPQPSKSEPPKSGSLSGMPTDEDCAFAGHTVEEVMSQLEVRRAQLAGSKRIRQKING